MPLYPYGLTALHQACYRGHLACVGLLLAAGASPNARTSSGFTPLHHAVSAGYTACASALLAAGADPGAVNEFGRSALFYAAHNNYAAGVRLLFEAAPLTASAKDQYGLTPLEMAFRAMSFDTVRCLLELGPLPPVGELLEQLQEARDRHSPAAVLPLYTTLVARQPLTPAEWEQLPGLCPGLGTVLPAVLERSEAEAGLLVSHLPPTDRKRLRPAALRLARAQRKRGVALPADIVRLLLVAAVAS